MRNLIHKNKIYFPDYSCASRKNETILINDPVAASISYFFFRETSVDNAGAVVRVSPIVSLSKVYVMHTHIRTHTGTEQRTRLWAGSLASHTYVTSRYLGYRASELSMRIWDRPQLRTCSPEALQL